MDFSSALSGLSKAPVILAAPAPDGIALPLPKRTVISPPNSSNPLPRVPPYLPTSLPTHLPWALTPPTNLTNNHPTFTANQPTIPPLPKRSRPSRLKTITPNDDGSHGEAQFSHLHRVFGDCKNRGVSDVAGRVRRGDAAWRLCS